MPRRSAAPRPPGAARPATPATPAFAERVQRWQRTQGRHHLPWQGTRDPYRVWLSEVMLQQTQVATVLVYYGRFLERFPTVQDLAAAPLADVLGLWSGLGYYGRARNLHRAAQAVVAEYGGRFPATAAGLQALPGIGRSTAAAIAAFCFGERAAILDGNVKRVLARALGFDGDLASAPETARLWALAESLLPHQGIESYTQGLMDLGAGICLARAPRCDACPLATDCIACAQGRPEAYPVKTRTRARGARFSAWLWLQSRERLWLVQRPERGIWAGLWSLPEFDTVDDARAELAALPGEPQPQPPFVHVLTHLDWTLQPLHWPLPERPPRALDALLAARWPQGRWVAMTDALSLGIPAPLRRLLLDATAG
ncbi:MAG: A/G-specific adenine glycosylase [Rubrivivax sp.]|nr:A/G-specific adenine glycosylase [Rubrivivax sp.]